jgi:5-formyltetrahydrofolate cyclo-ligase
MRRASTDAHPATGVMVRDHAADAGGDAEVLAAKRALREEVWAALSAAGDARFPGARNRIPNFTGAEAAAERLRGTDAWRAAATVKANPDSPQWPVRQRALEDGLVLYMAVPRLAQAEPFFLLDPASLEVSPRQASSIKGASGLGRTVAVEDLEPVDLVVTGCVAVDRTGARLGKGGGFADLEYALASAAGLIGPHTVIATTVHPVQVLAAGRIPMTAHDVPLDLVVTPDEVIVCDGFPDRPARRAGAIVWDDLTPEKIAAIPLLERLRQAAR